jgi:hypothetical protein
MNGRIRVSFSFGRKRTRFPLPSLSVLSLAAAAPSPVVFAACSRGNTTTWCGGVGSHRAADLFLPGFISWVYVDVDVDVDGDGYGIYYSTLFFYARGND